MHEFVVLKTDLAPDQLLVRSAAALETAHKLDTIVPGQDRHDHQSRMYVNH